MRTAVLCAAVFAVLWGLFLCTGAAAAKWRHLRPQSLIITALAGYFLWFAAFELAGLVCELTHLPLRALSGVSAALALFFVLAGARTLGGLMRETWRGRRRLLAEHGLYLVPAAAVVIFQCVYACLYTDGSADAAYYVAQASTAVWTDTIGRYDPTTGAALSVLPARYAFALYPYFSAVLSQVSGLPAIVAMRTVMSTVNILMMNLAYWLLGYTLFAGSARRALRESLQSADLFVAAVFVLNLFSATIYQPGAFALMRSYEGKALIVNLAIPAALTCCARLWLYEETSAESEKWIFRYVSCICLAGVCFAASAMFLAAAVCAALLPLVFRKGLKVIGGMIVAVAPVLLWAAVYTLAAHRWIVLAA